MATTILNLEAQHNTWSENRKLEPVRRGHTPNIHSEANEACREAKKHPLGLKPSGNALTSVHNLQMSMGAFARLPDPTLFALIESLDESSLLNLGSTCRGLFAYASHDQIWRDIAIEEQRPGFQWRGSWRASRRGMRDAKLPKIDCSHLFSDALYRPFQCTQLSLKPFVTSIPKPNEIERVSDLTAAEFNQRWADRPFILKTPVKQWKVYQDWNEVWLKQRFADTIFRAEAVDWPLHTYVDYMHNNDDESPLYLFDRNFVEKMNLKVGPGADYEPPECFGEDFFMLLGKNRPDHRWLIVGPERSGSTFHKDPNATSAWNAVIRGSKYWIMFPNSIVPPGVFMSADQSEVTSPLSIAEWLMTFHEEARHTTGCIEAICHEGEVLHVPSGWWHLVVNLEPAIAITQNFIPPAHLGAVIKFLKSKPDQISGFKSEVSDPCSLFLTELEAAHPALFKEMQMVTEKKRKWEDVIASTDAEGAQQNGFSFGFDVTDDTNE